MGTRLIYTSMSPHTSVLGLACIAGLSEALHLPVLPKQEALQLIKKSNRRPLREEHENHESGEWDEERPRLPESFVEQFSEETREHWQEYFPESRMEWITHNLNEEIHEEFQVASCKPSADLRAKYQWVYSPAWHSNNPAATDVWFTRVEAPRPYNAAKEVCESLGENVQIASIVTEEENEYVQSMWKDPDQCPVYWLNGYFNGKDYFWQYGGDIMNEPVEYSNWKTGYPNHLTNDLITINVFTGQWLNVAQSEEMAPICMLRCGTSYWQGPTK